MNIFEKETGIIGEVPMAHILQITQDFWEQARSIRKQIGKRSYMFDNYLSYLFDAVNHKLAFDASDEGHGGLSSFRSMIAEIKEGKTEPKENSLYQRIKEYVDSYPVGYQERITTFELYLTGLSGDLLNHAVEKYSNKLERNFGGIVDFVRIKELYDGISAMLGGEEQMERFNLLFKQRFLLVPPMMSFVQGFNNDMIFILNNRDDETGRFIFQLYLEDLDE